MSRLVKLRVRTELFSTTTRIPFLPDDVFALNGSIFPSFRATCLSSSDRQSAFAVQPSLSNLCEPMDSSHLQPGTRMAGLCVTGTRTRAFALFKWTLILFNTLLILTILGGAYLYFSQFRDRINADLSLKTPGPKYAWILATFAFAMLLTIPCMGLFGAIKHHVCLLIIYGSIFSMETLVIAVFRSFWVLIPAAVAFSAIGMLLLIRSEETDSSRETCSAKRLCANYV